MLENCDFIDTFSICGQSGAIQSWFPDTESVKLIFLLIVTFYLIKTKNRTKKLLT